MVTLQILVLPFLVRVRVAQQRVSVMLKLFFCICGLGSKGRQGQQGEGDGSNKRPYRATRSEGPNKKVSFAFKEYITNQSRCESTGFDLFMESVCYFKVLPISSTRASFCIAPTWATGSPFIGMKSRVGMLATLKWFASSGELSTFTLYT